MLRQHHTCREPAPPPAGRTPGRCLAWRLTCGGALVAAVAVVAAGLAAPPPDLGELERRLASAGDAERVELLNELAFAYVSTQPERAVDYAEQLLELARRLGRPHEEANALDDIGLARRYLGEYEQALRFALQALEVRERLGDPAGLAGSYNNLGVLYWRLQDYPRAVDYHSRALAIKRETGATGAIPSSLNNLALVHLSMGELERARACYEELLTLVEAAGSDDENLGKYLNNLGELHRELGEPESALSYALRAVEVDRRRGDTGGLAVALNTLGLVQQQRGDPAAARRAFDEALACSGQSGNRNTEKEVHRNLADLLAAMGEPGPALEHMRQHARLTEAIFSQDSSQKVAELQERFASERRQREILALRTEQALREVELARQRSVRNLLALLSAALLLAVAAGGVAVRTIRRSNRLIARRNEELGRLDAVVRAVNRELDLEQLLHTLLREAAGLLGGARRGAFLLLDHDSGSYRCAAALGDGQLGLDDLELAPAAVEARLLEHATAVGDGVLWLGPLQAPSGPAEPLDNALPRGRLTIAARVGETVEGYLLLAGLDDRRVFSAWEVQKLDRFREHVVSAIAKARHLRQLEREKERAERALAELQVAHRRVEELSRTDPLTGLLNRRGVLERVERELRGSASTGRPVAVVLGDVDDFKAFNDRHGHDCGDHVLREVATALRLLLRGQDHVGRWGGEEFLLVLPETDAAGARSVAESVRRRLHENPIPYHGARLVVQMTLGVSALSPGLGFEAAIRAADDALRHGKAAGKDRVVVSDPAAAGCQGPPT